MKISTAQPIEFKEELIAVGKERRTFRALPVILAAIVAMWLLNQVSTVHGAIIALDRHVAVTLNSLVGVNYALDQLMGRMTTRSGDAIVLAIMIGFLAVHCLRPQDLHEKARRIAFWGWNGVLCVSTYMLCCWLQNFFVREIPLAALPTLHNITTIYGLVPHTSANESFPSGHALAFLFFAVASWRIYRSMSLPLLAIGALVLAVRLVIGLHWLSDMLLGSLPLSLLLAALSRETPLETGFGN